jgi:O-antigen ligase
LAASIGGLFVLSQSGVRRPCESTGGIRQWCKLASIAIVLCALLTLVFWQFQHAEGVASRRVLSALNQNDFSWRNRLGAWEGSLQMMVERPWLGLGWKQIEIFCACYYSPERIDETMAVQMNDYFILGATLGIPALSCFCMYLWLAFTRSARRESRPTEKDGCLELDWLKAVCRAGALVLAVGFWFDGGLFKLPTAAMFWILLELGRV